MLTTTLLRRGALALLVVALATLPTPALAKEGSRFREDPSVSGSAGVVASISAYASQVGIDVLTRGGNAMDAAVATVFAVGVTRPEMCGIGGGGFLVYRSASGTVAALDFRETAPGAVKDGTTFTEGIQKDGSGHTVVGVPGTVAGMVAAREKYGSQTLTLGQLIRSSTPGGGTRAVPYAYELARDGFPVTAELATNLFVHKPRLLLFPATAAIYGGGEAHYLAGSTLVQTDYARSLGLIASHGRAAFYGKDPFPEGPSIASLIALDMALARNVALGDEGLITVADLAAYEAKWRTPLIGKYRGHDIIAMPAPTSGGIATLEILNILEGFDLRAFGQSSANHLHVLAEAQKIAFADREAYVGDPDKVAVPSAMLTSKEYATRRRAEIRMNEAAGYRTGDVKIGHTTHVSVIDTAGNAVAVTCTVNYPFGSAVVAPGTGFVLNNHLNDFSGPTLTDGTTPHPNRAQAGKRPRSSTSPTIVAHSGKPVLAVGAGGGTTIIMGVVQTIVNVVDFNLDVARAVDAERIEARPFGTNFDDLPRALQLEDGKGRDGTPRIAPTVVTELENRKHQITYAPLCPRVASDDPHEYQCLPVVQAVDVTLPKGLRQAAWEPRAEGSPCAQGQGSCRLRCPPQDDPVLNPIAMCVQPPPR